MHGCCVTAFCNFCETWNLDKIIMCIGQGFGGFFVTTCKDEEKSRPPESWLPSWRMFCVTANLSKKYIGIFVLIQKTVFYLIQYTACKCYQDSYYGIWLLSMPEYGKFSFV